jgi:hypothetical protein
MSELNKQETTIKAASLFNSASKFWGKSKRSNSDEES